jgi:hypothetical protein
VVNKLWRELMERPEAAEWLHLEPASDGVRLHLLHLIAAHHGALEFGSPVLPKTPEAVALHHVDNIDAKLEMFRKAYESGKELAPGIIEKVCALAGEHRGSAAGGAATSARGGVITASPASWDRSRCARRRL